MRLLLTLLFTSFLIISISVDIHSQAYSRFYTNYNNDFALNPALASKKDYSQVGVNFIREWAGFEGSPMMVNLYGTIVESDVERWATSIVVDYETFGLSSFYNINPGYSFNVMNYDRTFSLAASVDYKGISFDVLKLPQDVLTASQRQLGVNIGGYFASVAPSEEYESSHYYVGLSSQIASFSFNSDTGRRILTNANLLLGYKLFMTEYFHIEPRINFGFNFTDNSIYSSSLNVELEQYDYAYGDKFGWYADLGFIYNNQKTINYDTQFTSSLLQGSYVTIGAGIMLNMGSGNNLMKAGSFFEYGLNSLSNTNAINFGIQLNYFLFDIGW